VTSSQALSAGSFSVALSDCFTTNVHDHGDLWIEVQVDGASMGRTKLGAVPYAVEADSASRAVGPLDSRIGALDGRIGSVEGRASSLESHDGTVDSRVTSLDSSMSALGSRVSTLESVPAPTYTVITRGNETCQLLTNFRSAGATNTLVQTGPLFADSSCNTPADGSCHPICAALAVLDPTINIAGCCGVGPYYSKGLVEIVAYR